MKISKHFYVISLIIVLASVCVALLFYFTPVPNAKKNGFNRKFSGTTLSLLNTRYFDRKIINIAGSNASDLFFVTDHDNELLVTDKELSETHYLNLPTSSIMHEPLFHSFVDFPIIKTLSSRSNSAFRYNMMDGSTDSDTLRTDFSRCIAVTPASFIFKSLDTSGMQPVFLKYDLVSGIKKELKINEILDGFENYFDSDGLLLYDNIRKSILYTLFYSNSFICLDTNLNLRYLGKTIDTFHSPMVKTVLASNEAKKLVTLASPPRFVNGASCVSDGLLYINSALKADNEAAETFEANSVVDVYETSAGTYQGSFYIPKNQDKKAIFFMVSGDTLIAVYGKCISTFKIPNLFHQTAQEFQSFSEFE